MARYSQFGQDQYVLSLKGDSGVFIDIGAYDGVIESNTYLLEKKGWTGVCVEPNPDAYNRLKDNRNCVCIHACAYSHSDGVKYQLNDGSMVGWSGIPSEYDARHSARIESMCTYKVIDTPSMTLDDIIGDHTHVDYLSIDTEGSELEVLKGINWDRVSIDIIGVECNYPDTDSVKGIHTLLTDRGYTVIKRIGMDRFYRKDM